MTSTAPFPKQTLDFYRDRTVAVTGGAGFIGGHLAETLLNAGATVKVIDDLSTSTTELPNDLIERFPNQYQFIHASILEPDALDETLESAAVVFHNAALASVPRSIAEPSRTHEVNDLGTLRIIEAARRNGTKRIVNASSSSVYGDSPELPKHEKMPTDPLSPYAASKAAAEVTLRAWAASLELDCISLRYFNIFGPRQRPGGPYAAVVPAFINALANNQQPIIFGDGRQSRDFTYINNVIHANLLAGASTKRLAGQAVNVGAGERITLLQLLEDLQRLLDRTQIKPRFEPTREGDVAHSLAAIDEATRVIAYRPIVSIQQGLAATVDWFSQPNTADHNHALRLNTDDA